MGVLLLPLTVIWLASTSNNSNAANNWLTERLQPFDLELFESSNNENGNNNNYRGLKTTRNRSPGDTIMIVKDAITCETIFDRYPHIQHVAAAPTTSPKFTQEQILALGLLEMKKSGGDSGYIQTLPQEQYSVMNLPENLQNCLPRCYRDSVDASKGTVESLYDHICHCCSMMEISSFTMAPTATATMSPPTLQDFQWAFASVRSRSIAADELSAPSAALVNGSGAGSTTNAAPPTMMLLPAFDLLNHKSGVPVSLEYAKQNDQWTLTTQETYQKGDEVFLNYGDRDHLKMLFTYGFCCQNDNRDNDNIALFDLQDLLEASHVACPAIFTIPVLTSIQPQLEAATTTATNAEERAMFSMTTGLQPRDSLQQGLTMMQQVAQQLSRTTTAETPPLLLEPADIIHALQIKRRDELVEGLKRIQMATTSSSWEGVRRSIEILLQAEVDLLGSPE